MQDLFQIQQLLHAKKFASNSPFSYLGKNLTSWLNDLLNELNVTDKPVLNGKISPFAYISGRVYISEGAVVEPTAMISGPCFVGPDAEIRHGAYIRGSVYVGAKCVVGHTTEAKGSVFLDGAKAGHFAYVGDSILGQKVNLGAGTKLANFKFRGDEVRYRSPQDQKLMSTGLKKLGALMGDGAQTGCNAVLDPGAILFPNTAVLACAYFRGTLTEGIARTK